MLTLDVRGLQAAPPYIENEDTEEGWLRADFALDAEKARVAFVEHCGLDPEGIDDLTIRGPVGMRPDATDENWERWVVCEDVQAFGRYWHASFI
jgi:hypothetical protein